VYETTGKIETTFQHDGVKVRVEARELPRGSIVHNAALWILRPAAAL
jgi:hypothetical protein